MKREDIEKAAKYWLDIQFLNKERSEWDEEGSLVDQIQGLMDHDLVALNLQIVDLEETLKETIECDNENMLKMMARITELEKMLLQPFCTEHRKHVSNGFCDECNGDRHLIQPRSKE